MVLVPWSESSRMWGDEGWEELPTMQALAKLDWARHAAWELRDFVASTNLAWHSLRELDDHEVLDLVRTSIQHGDMRVLRYRGNKSQAPSEATEARQLLRQIEKETRGKLAFGGRLYRLVLGDDLAGLPGRDAYEVVSQTNAQRILEDLAREANAPAKLLAKARQRVSKDWRPPLSQPDGLVLLQEVSVRASAFKDDDGPAITPSQLKALVDKATLVIHVVDLSQRPQEGLAYQIATPDGSSVQGQLDEEGRGSAKSTRPGVFTVSFPDLDGGDWDGDGALALPEDKARSEASRHTVKQGDRLPNIASEHHFARWQTIWEFGDGQGNPFILNPGDSISIPSKVARKAEVEGGKAEYVVQSTPETLRVRFADAAGDEPVLFRATPDQGDDMFEGELSDDGTMEIELPPATRRVQVELYAGDGDDPFVTYRLDVGHLDPCSEVSGVQGRLANLGYYDGESDGDENDATCAAIVQFRRDYGLPASDEIDEDLENALRWLHDDDDDVADGESDHTTPADVATNDGNGSQDRGRHDAGDEGDDDDERDDDSRDDGDEDEGADDAPIAWEDDEWESDGDNGHAVDESGEVKPW